MKELVAIASKVIGSNHISQICTLPLPPPPAPPPPPPPPPPPAPAQRQAEERTGVEDVLIREFVCLSVCLSLIY